MSLIDRDMQPQDVFDRIEALEADLREIKEYALSPQAAGTVPEQPTWSTLSGWVITGEVFRDVGGKIVLDPSEPMIQVASGGYIQSSDYVAGTSGFQIDGGAAEFNDVTVRGTIYAPAGEIGGFDIGANTITTDSGAVGLNSETTGGTDWRIWAGHATPGSAPFRVDENGNLVATSATIEGEITAISGTIGGWTATSNVLHSGNNITLDANDKSIWVNSETFGQKGIQLQYNAGVPRIYAGDGEDRYFKFDGENVTLGGSLIVHGQIESAVLSYQAIQATSGSILVTPSAGRLLNDATTVASPTTFDIDVEDPEYGHTQLFVAGDILRLRKIDGTENWVTVSSVTDNGTYYTYTCTLSNGSDDTFSAGTPILNYGQSGAGFLHMSADDSEGPFYSIRTWQTNPWTSGNVTERVRLGNMRNAFGTGANDRYGFGVGDYSAGNYLSYNAEIAGEFVLSAGDDVLTIDSDGLTINTGTLSSANKIKLDISGSSGGEIYAHYQSVGGGALAGDQFWVKYAAGTTGILMMTDYTIINGASSPKPTYVAGGLTVGWESNTITNLPTAPADQDAHIRNDVRIGGGLYIGSTDTDPDADDIHYEGDLRPVRGDTSYTGTVLIDSGEDGPSSGTTLTTSYQTLCTATITIPSGGATLMVWGRVHVDQSSYGATHIESRIVVGGVLKDYARERSINVSNIEYNTPLFWVGDVSAGSLTFTIQCRKNVNSGGLFATSEPRTIMYYALYC